MRFDFDFEQSEGIRGQAYSRDPEDGTNSIRGSVHFSQRDAEPVPLRSLKELHPRIYEMLKAKGRELEERFSDAVSFRFHWDGTRLALEDEKPLERSPEAAFAIAVELVRQRRIDKSEALRRVGPEELRRLLSSRFEADDERRLEERGRLIALGVGGGGGATTGRLALSAEKALEIRAAGETPILAVQRLGYREREVLPLVGGMVVGEGSLGAARQFDKPCVLVESGRVEDGSWRVEERAVPEGAAISLEGYSGKIFSAGLPVVPGELTEHAFTLLQWADEMRTIGVRANAANSEEVAEALFLGAEGVGLCRIDYTFLAAEALPLFQMVLREVCEQKLERSPSIDELTRVVETELRAMIRELPKGTDSPFTLRLLDFPLSMLLREWSDSEDLKPDYFSGLLGDWRGELNPLQGLRCGRLAIAYPTLMNLQIRAAVRAWKKVGTESVRLQLMFPGTSDPKEIELFRARVEQVCLEEEVVRPRIGSMLETPRACLLAGEIAKLSDFCSFGTGDLTEAACGLSRYDSQLSFLPSYLEQRVFDEDPFLQIDRKGVGALMRIATEQISSSHPELELGICGAQAAQPDSLRFCHELGLTYVSAPPRMVPMLRLVCAQMSCKKQPV